MEAKASNRPNKEKTNPSPRRGQIKKKMFSKIAKLAVSAVSMAGKLRRRNRGGNGGCLSSPSPRRGQIKKKMFSKIAKSAVSAVSMAGKLRRRSRGGNGGCFGSTSINPEETPSGYNSEGHSDP